MDCCLPWRSGMKACEKYVNLPWTWIPETNWAIKSSLLLLVYKHTISLPQCQTLNACLTFKTSSIRCVAIGHTTQKCVEKSTEKWPKIFFFGMVPATMRNLRKFDFKILKSLFSTETSFIWWELTLPISCVVLLWWPHRVKDIYHRICVHKKRTWERLCK